MRKVIISMLGILSLAAHAHISQVTTLSNGKQTIVVCSDYHQSSLHAQPQDIVAQQDELISFASENNAVVIVEDAYCGNMKVLIADTSARIEPTACAVATDVIRTRLKSPLNYLFTRCVNQGIQCFNVETRFSEFRTAANYVQCMRNRLKRCTEAATSSRAQALCAGEVAHLKNIIEVQAAALLSYLETQYTSLTAALQTSSEFNVEHLEHILMSLTDQPWNFSLFSYQQQLSFLLLLIDARLLELTTALQIALHQDQPIILFIAGASHGDTCKKIVARQGYATTASFGEHLRMNATRTAYEEPHLLNLETVFQHIKTSSPALWSRHVPFAHIFSTIAHLIGRLV